MGRGVWKSAALLSVLTLAWDGTAGIVGAAEEGQGAVIHVPAGSEFRVDGTRFLSGCCGHRFVEQDGRWLIQVRQVNLIDCDQNLRNPSIVI